MKTSTRLLLATGLILAASLGNAASAADISCEMKFSMSGWSAFYKKASGKGTITCNNGQSYSVRLEARGGGLTAGKSSIENGKGEFSGIKSADELFGSYVAAEAHAGAVKSSEAKVMTKGEVSLALSGTGRGWDLGVAFGRFTIKRG